MKVILHLLAFIECLSSFCTDSRTAVRRPQQRGGVCVSGVQAEPATDEEYDHTAREQLSRREWRKEGSKRIEYSYEGGMETSLIFTLAHQLASI